MVENLLTAIHAFPMPMLTFLSVDEILLLKYMNCSTNFRGLSFNVGMTPSWLKHMNSVLSGFKKGPITLANFSMLCSRHLAHTGVFMRSARSSA